MLHKNALHNRQNVWWNQLQRPRIEALALLPQRCVIWSVFSFVPNMRVEKPFDRPVFFVNHSKSLCLPNYHLNGPVHKPLPSLSYIPCLQCHEQPLKIPQWGWFVREKSGFMGNLRIWFDKWQSNSRVVITRVLPAANHRLNDRNLHCCLLLDEICVVPKFLGEEKYKPGSLYACILMR